MVLFPPLLITAPYGMDTAWPQLAQGFPPGTQAQRGRGSFWALFPKLTIPWTKGCEHCSFHFLHFSPPQEVGIQSRKPRQGAWTSSKDPIPWMVGVVSGPASRLWGHLTSARTPQTRSRLLSLWLPLFSPFFVSHMFSLHLI